jgi:hypothetical protein
MVLADGVAIAVAAALSLLFGLWLLRDAALVTVTVPSAPPAAVIGAGRRHRERSYSESA